MEGGLSTNVERPHDTLRGSQGRPVRHSRYPLRMPKRLGCSMFGCSITLPDSESFYCCDSHREMADSMDSSAVEIPCIVFDGLKDMDVALCSSLLHRSVDGVSVGIPTIQRGIFSVAPWKLGPEFQTELLPAEGCRDLVFFVEDPPERYPLMGETSCSWDEKTYYNIDVHEDTVSLIQYYVTPEDGCTIDQDLEDQCAIWELFRYSHAGVYLFCLSYDPQGSTLKRKKLTKKDRGVEVRGDALDSALLKWIGSKRKRGQMKPSINQWGSKLDKSTLEQTAGDEADPVEGIEADQEGIEADQVEGIKAMRAYLHNLMEEAVNDENLDLDTRYRIEELSDSTMRWFDTNGNADIAALREKVVEAERSLKLIITRNL